MLFRSGGSDWKIPICIGLNWECILKHPDYGPLTHRAVLHQAGPLLRNKDGKYYRQKGRSNNAENKYVLYCALENIYFHCRLKITNSCNPKLLDFSERSHIVG